jgi:hypothetical protein
VIFPFHPCRGLGNWLLAFDPRDRRGKLTCLLSWGLWRSAGMDDTRTHVWTYTSVYSSNWISANERERERCVDSRLPSLGVYLRP